MYSLAESNGVLWAGLESGNVVRCDITQGGSSCRPWFKGPAYAITMLVIKDDIFVGLNQGTMLK